MFYPAITALAGMAFMFGLPVVIAYWAKQGG